ncbi:F-box domain-containing protein [Ceratocystis lukuohia]|uniref:F-box domain-containing protein n=1 Tax=Ceratocystis lukuohia TaxID=2019550 RepID=A0ABR4MNZ3_9PEZI
MAQFDDLPNELVQLILTFISAEDNLRNVQRVNRLLHMLGSDPRIWRYHCSLMRYWSPHHSIEDKFRLSLAEVDWKRLYLLRRRRNAEAEHLLSSAISSRPGRMMRLEQVSVLGLDVKQYLLDQISLNFMECHDALARKFHADVSLSSMHRAMGIARCLRLGPHKMKETQLESTARAMKYSAKEWNRDDLEGIMTGLDMFALTSNERDISWSSTELDRYAEEFRRQNSDFGLLSYREKALRLNKWLRRLGYTGNKPIGKSFSHLRCAYLGQVLAHEDHMANPLIQCVIYCCVAARLGINADCCLFPGKLHVIVRAPDGEYLDGPFPRKTRAIGDEDRFLVDMFMSPCDSDSEISFSDLKQSLVSWGINSSEDGWLEPMHPASVALRNCRNIASSCERIHRMAPNSASEACSLMTNNNYHNVLLASYASLWIRAVLTPTWDVSWKQCVLELVETVRASWPEDYWIVQRFCPPFNGLGMSRTRAGTHSMITTLTPYRPSEIEQQRDQMRIQPTYRDARGGPAKYHVGQVFEHTKYGSIGVITGWIEDRSPRGYISSGDRDSGTEADEIKTIFYYCLAGQNALPALVSEGNIRIIRNLAKVPTELISRCGKYFTNIDAVKGEFISNIKDAYPDN